MDEKELTIEEAWDLGWQKAKDSYIGVTIGSWEDEMIPITDLLSASNILGAYLFGYDAYFGQIGEDHE